MKVTRLQLRDFRSYERAELRVGPGPDGRWPGTTGPARRTSSRRCTSPARAARAGPPTSARWCASAPTSTRLELEAEDDRGRHEITVGFQPGEAKRLQVDGAPVDRLTDAEARPLVSVFLPDRLELVLGAPALRRAHLDQVVAALWPGPRRDAAGVLGGARAAQRADRRHPRRPGRPRLAAGVGRRARPPRDRADARPRRGRRRGCAPRFVAHAAGVGLEGDAGAGLPAALEGRRRRRSSPPSSPSASTATSSAASPATARTATSSRSAAPAASCGRTDRGASSGSACSRCCSPSARSWRQERGAPPLMLLDDVMSELDAGRRERLVEVLRGGGQSVIATTDLAHVPGAEDAGRRARRRSRTAACSRARA